MKDPRSYTTGQLALQLASLRESYGKVIERGGYAPRLATAIDNIKRELEHRQHYSV